MSLKTLLFSVGCVVAWFVLLPLLVIGGGLALFAHAVLGELAALLTGTADKSIDRSAAREMARRMCGGHGGRAFAVRRKIAR
jgi:hypothetical protein